MKFTLLLLVITLFPLSGAFAMQTKCNFCSEVNADYYNDGLSERVLPISFIEADDNIFVAYGAGVKKAAQQPSVADNKEIKLLPSLPINIDGLLELINNTENIEEFTQEKVDLLANFRNGDDVVVPLGFLFYINKKF